MISVKSLMDDILNQVDAAMPTPSLDSSEDTDGGARDSFHSVASISSTVPVSLNASMNSAAESMDIANGR